MICVKFVDKVVMFFDFDGYEIFKSGCFLGGIVDLLIEFYCNVLRLVILGDSLIVEVLLVYVFFIDIRCYMDEVVLDDLIDCDFVVVVF